MIKKKIMIDLNQLNEIFKIADGSKLENRLVIIVRLDLSSQAGLSGLPEKILFPPGN